MGAIIVAAGMAQRMGGIDKMLLDLSGLPVVVRTVEVFETCPEIGRVVLVLSAASRDQGRALAAARGWTKVRVCVGGARRQDSVWAGLQCLEGCDWVAIHDGARPLVTLDLIQRGLRAARGVGAAVAATPVKDTIKVATPQGLVEATLDRTRLWAVQTPQVFRYDLICRAHREVQEEATDDAALVERLGHPVLLYPGTYENIKITTPEDLAIAAALLRRQQGKAGTRE